MPTDPLLWRNNYSVDEATLDSVRDAIITHPGTYDKEYGYWTTFFIEDLDHRPEIVFLDLMMEWSRDAMDALYLKHRVGFTLEHWCQIYDGCHIMHDHFNVETMVSWVYFARPADKPCFYYMYNGEKVYPKQEKGDFIVFPSFLMHGVDASHEDRITIAGNILWNNMYNGTYQTLSRVRPGLFLSEVEMHNGNADYEY